MSAKTSIFNPVSGIEFVQGMGKGRLTDNRADRSPSILLGVRRVETGR